MNSSQNNLRRIAPRKYYGVDAQLKNSTETPAQLLLSFRRILCAEFTGAYFYFLQNIVNIKNQFVVKYDWYDPNTEVSGGDIGNAGTKLTPADIKYSTLGFGFILYLNDNAKIVFWHDRIRNEKTTLPGYTKMYPMIFLPAGCNSNFRSFLQVPKSQTLYS